MQFPLGNCMSKKFLTSIKYENSITCWSNLGGRPLAAVLELCHQEW